MSQGLEIRAQIDAEVVKGLLLINGGGAIALLTFLPNILKEPNYVALAISVLWSLPLFSVGLVTAVIHNRLRRVCSLKYEAQNYSPNRCTVFPFSLSVFNRAPCVCHLSQVFMWMSVIMFVIAVSLVTIGGLESVEKINKQYISSQKESTPAPNKALNATPKSGAH